MESFDNYVSYIELTAYSRSNDVISDKKDNINSYLVPVVSTMDLIELSMLKI